MGSRRFGNQASFTVPRPAIVSSSSASDVEEITPVSSQVETKKKQVRWSDDMDQALIDTLLEVVLVGPRRTKNGFKAEECTKVVNKVLERCQVVVGVVHVRAKMKTLKTEYKEITELFKTSGFGLDENGRITADPLVWEKHLQDNPNAKNLKGKLCPRYYDLATIFGNDNATGDRAVTGNDFVQMNEDEINNPVGVGVGDEDEMEEAHPTQSNVPNASNEVGQKKGPRAKRKRHRPMDDAASALTIIAQSSQKIANALEKQEGVDVQVMLDKVRGLGLADDGVMAIMEIFMHDEKKARYFFGINDEAFLHAWVNKKLGK